MEHIGNEDGGPVSINSPTHQEWQAQKATIEKFYITEDLSLKEVVSRMSQLGFFATPRMYKARLSIWGIGKYLSRQDWIVIARLYMERQSAGKPQTMFKVHNKTRNIEDLRSYLKLHKIPESKFFAEAMASQLPNPQHIRCFTPDSSNSILCGSSRTPVRIDGVAGGEDCHTPSTFDTPFMIPPSNTLKISTHGYSSLAHDQRNLDAGVVPEASNSILESPRPQPPDIHFTSMRNDFHLEHNNDLVNSTALSRLSKLSDWRRIANADIGTALGDERKVHSPPNVTQSTSATASDTKQLVGHVRLHETCQRDAHSTYTSACMLACTYNVVGKVDELEQCLKDASFSFRQICSSHSPFILTEVCTLLTWLEVHVEGYLAESIMKRTFRNAAEVLGDENSICFLLEWMTATSANGLDECRIDSTMLKRIWQGFRDILGRYHPHTIVASYCLSFHLLKVDKAYAEAESYLEHLWKISAKTLGSADLLTINILATLSRAQRRQGNFDAALETITRGLRETPLGLNHPHRLELLLRKAAIYWKLGLTEDAERLYWVVVKGRVATLGRHHRSTLRAHKSLVEILQDNGRWASMKGDAQRVLSDPQVAVEEYESWWRRMVDENRGSQGNRTSSEEREWR